jgi:hypothetical protein
MFFKPFDRQLYRFLLLFFLRTSDTKPCVETLYNLMRNAISDHFYFGNRKKSKVYRAKLSPFIYKRCHRKVINNGIPI